MGNIVASGLPCPSHKADTNGSDCFVKYEDGGGHCFVCNLDTYEGSKGDLMGRWDGQGKWELLMKAGEFEFSDEDGYTRTEGSSEDGDVELTKDDPFGETEEEVVEIKEKGSYKGRRGITAKVMEFYGVGTYQNVDFMYGKSKRGHSEDEVRFTYPSGGVKKRRMDIPKSDTAHWSNSAKGTEFFGRNLFPAGSHEKLVITEGEYDALAAFQMLSDNGKWTNPVVSLPSANPALRDDGKNIFKDKANMEWLDSFKYIIFSIDSDNVASNVVEVASKLFPNKVYVMDHGQYKDANEMLENGAVKEYKSQWWTPKKYKPSTILSDSDDYLKLFSESRKFEHFKTGIPELDEKALGICKGFVTLIQAPSGLGKTEFMRYLEYKILSNTNYKVAVCHKEESKLRSLLGVVSYDLKRNVTLESGEEVTENTEDIKESIKQLTKGERFLTVSIDETQGNDETMKQLEYLVTVMGVDYIFIEPVQDIVVGANSSEKEGKLSDLMARMGNLCGSTNVGIVVIAHQNGEGGAMYSKMITMKAGLKIVLEADRESEDKEEANRTYLKVVEKNRTARGFGKAGSVVFDLDSYTLSPYLGVEEPSVQPKDDVPF